MAETVETGPPRSIHPAWLPAGALRSVGARSTVVIGPTDALGTVLAEASEAGGTVGQRDRDWPPLGSVDLLLALGPADPRAGAELVTAAPPGPEGYLLTRRHGTTIVLAESPNGLLYGFFHVVRRGGASFGADHEVEFHRPVLTLRMLDHWDNMDVHPVMGQVERGYAGGSLFWQDGRFTDNLARIRQYARLLAAIGINAVAVNNVNVHATEALLLTDRLEDVVAIAGQMRPFGIRVHLSVSFAAPIGLGGLATADPLDEGVRHWWSAAAARVYAAIPDFGGFVVKADSEGQPGPAGYGRSHADGANLLADALAPHGGMVHWRAFVYNHRQDWRDRRTDRARAGYDHFTPLDGHFRRNVVLQVKHGPMDFQTREPVSPVLAAMPDTRLAVELQATQEYTGQQRHVCYLAPLWSQILRFALGPDGSTVAEIAAGRTAQHGPGGDGGGLVAVSNVGDDRFWTGHPLAQANLFALGRLAWDPDLDPGRLLDEWIDLTFPAAEAAGTIHRLLHAMLDESWLTYELYTAPLGVGFMVDPGDHYGPSIDGYEYSPWGTYHFADRDGVGVDRTRASGTGFTGQYPAPWADLYESLETCPDEVLLFFHHVPYQHRLQTGTTVIQHIYDTHFEGVRRVEEMVARWSRADVAHLVGPDWYREVQERLQEQLRCAREWRDQVNTYFFRKSGVPDAHGRVIH